MLQARLKHALSMWTPWLNCVKVHVLSTKLQTQVILDTFFAFFTNFNVKNYIWNIASQTQTCIVCMSGMAQCKSACANR